jgi:DNA invertase Pin-like site-specific DNA recombinase
MVNLVAVFGQLERDLTAERTVAALDERGKLYGYKSGRLPLGYDRTPGQEEIRINAQAAELVRLVFAHRSTGASMRDIAELVSHRVGRKWYASTVKTILDNEPVYRGTVDHWPAIL